MAHEINARCKTLVVKEEGDTSHMNKAYGLQVSKDEKKHIRADVHALSPSLGIKMDQWYLISMSIIDWNRIKK